MIYIIPRWFGVLQALKFTPLPLHAVGPYAKKGHNLSHFYISSYTLTLVALIRTRQQFLAMHPLRHFVSIGQLEGNPKQKHTRQLLRVTDELCDIAHRVAPILLFTSLSNNDAIVSRALDALSRHQWVHHGLPWNAESTKNHSSPRSRCATEPLIITDIIRPLLQKPGICILIGLSYYYLLAMRQAPTRQSISVPRHNLQDDFAV